VAGNYEINPLKITKRGHFKDSKYGPCTKSRLLEGPETFFGPLNGMSVSEGHFGAKKVDYKYFLCVQHEQP
jgi:hypothetical protein